MRIRRNLWLQAIAAPLLVAAQTTTTSTGVVAVGDVANTANVTYISYSSTITLSSSSGSMANASNATTTSNDLTVLTGSPTSNGTGTLTSTSARPSNTQACNGYPEFCTRKYSNITMVAAHNFPFTRRNNAARNQDNGVVAQLNDGIRMLQAQAHYINNTMFFCHTSCDLLNAGTVQDQFTQIRQWLDSHPYEVITILLGNYAQVDPNLFVPAIQNSGLQRYAYTPSQIPMSLASWPTLGELILSGKRAIIFMDYKADQKAIPYLLDEFSQMWETPFSPTNPAFPCVTERPPGLNRQQSEERLYLANHNLNVDISLLSFNILVPNTAAINTTNSDSPTTSGSLGLAARSCASSWNRPPNFLLVDFYNQGPFPGSVFQVAADMNNVTYSRGTCCGGATSAAAPSALPHLPPWIHTGALLLLGLLGVLVYL